MKIYEKNLEEKAEDEEVVITFKRFSNGGFYFSYKGNNKDPVKLFDYLVNYVYRNEQVFKDKNNMKGG